MDLMHFAILPSMLSPNQTAAILDSSLSCKFSHRIQHFNLARWISSQIKYEDKIRYNFSPLNSLANWIPWLNLMFKTSKGWISFLWKIMNHLTFGKVSMSKYLGSELPCQIFHPVIDLWNLQQLPHFHKALFLNKCINMLDHKWFWK